MATLTRTIIGLIIAALLYSCNFITGIQGNGNVITQEREVSASFNAIDAGYGLEVVIKYGDSDKIVVEADENLQEHIITRVNNNTLYIETDTNIGRATSKQVFVTYTSLNALNVNSGANLSNVGTINADMLEVKSTSGGTAKLDIASARLEAKATSGGVLRMKGSTDRFEGNASTGGNLMADELIAQNVEAKATTGGNLKIHAAKTFKGDTSTGGNINYSGNPETININDGDKTGGNISKG